MSTFKITDEMSTSLTVTPNQDSAIAKYFKNLSDLSISSASQLLESGMTLADAGITSATTGVNFLEPIDVGTSQLDLTIGAGLSGSFSIFVPHGTSAMLLDPDPYEDPIPVALDDRYVSFGVVASVSGGATAGLGDLKFGFNGGSSASFSNYLKFSVKPSAPQLLDAIRDTVAQFMIPADIEDLQALRLGQIVVMDGNGSLKFSASANLLAAINPLASASLPGPLSDVAVKGGGSITVGADVQLSGEYQVRVNKVANNLVHLAYYHKKSSAFDVKATASVGITATFGETDLLGKLMSAISSDPKADTDQLKKAGLSATEIRNIQEAIKASIERTVELAVSAELNATREDKAAFSYDIDLGSLTASSRAAIHSALDGDLSALTLNPLSPLPGILAARDLFTNVRQQKYALTINLLGIYNLGWLSKLIESGKVIHDPTTGSLVIADSVTASRISMASVNLGVADSEKLRKVLAEGFLITVAYHGARRSGLTPALTIAHSFFALNQHTSQETLRDELDVSVALDLMDQSSRDRIVASAPEFGRTLYFATTEYDANLASQLFLFGNQACTPEFYQQAGLEAVACLIHEGDMDEARLRPTRDVDLWRKMKGLGQPGIKSLFPGVPDPVVGAIIADYSLICWWAGAMHTTAIKLVAMKEFLSTHPSADDENNDFKKLRNDLADHLRRVAADTKEEFGRPWGLLAMFLASGKRAGRKCMLVGRALTLANEQPVGAHPGMPHLQTA